LDHQDWPVNLMAPPLLPPPFAERGRPPAQVRRASSLKIVVTSNKRVPPLFFTIAIQAFFFLADLIGLPLGYTGPGSVPFVFYAMQPFPLFPKLYQGDHRTDNHRKLPPPSLSTECIPPARTVVRVYSFWRSPPISPYPGFLLGGSIPPNQRDPPAEAVDGVGSLPPLKTARGLPFLRFAKNQRDCSLLLRHRPPCYKPLPFFFHRQVPSLSKWLFSLPSSGAIPFFLLL